MTMVLDSVLGQPKARAMLGSAATSAIGAFLLVGPPGVGKRKAAAALAAAIVCPKGCGRCEVCDRVLRGIHPDVSTYGPEGLTFPVETIREAVASAAQSPLEAERRVIVLEEADRIAERSQNALLKALEEPHPRLSWVLVADSLDAFLPTVISRCQVIEFTPVPQGAIRDALAASDIPASVLDQVVAVARGSLAVATALATDPSARSVRELAIEAATERLTPSQAMAIVDRLSQIAGEAKAVSQQRHADELDSYDSIEGKARGTASARRKIMERHKRELRRLETQIFADMCSWLGETYRDLAAAAASGADAVVQADHRPRIEGASTNRTASDWLELADGCIVAQLSIRDNANPVLAVESLLLRHAAGSDPG